MLLIVSHILVIFLDWTRNLPFQKHKIGPDWMSPVDTDLVEANLGLFRSPELNKYILAGHLILTCQCLLYIFLDTGASE